MEIFEITSGFRNMPNIVNISNSENMLIFINTGLNEIIEDVSKIFYDKEEEEEEEDKEEWIINNKRKLLLEMIHHWITTQDEVINEKKNEICDLIKKNKSLVYHNDELQEYINKLTQYDMRLKQTKDKSKYSSEKQIMGNSHKNYILRPNCKQCKGSICGRCVKHGG
jgi:hypothetical protein